MLQDSGAVWLETERLILREMEQKDLKNLCKILQDDEVMYAYEGALSDKESQQWLDKQRMRYREEGVGLCAVILKACGTLIGQCGLTYQLWNEKPVLEIGYLFQKAYWHKGYATEAAIACKQYAFHVLKADRVVSIIRDTNVASQQVAIRNGMHKAGECTKYYRNVTMPHIVYSIARGQ